MLSPSAEFKIVIKGVHFASQIFTLLCRFCVFAFKKIMNWIWRGPTLKRTIQTDRLLKKQQQKNMLFRKLKADLEERAHRSVTKCSHSKSFPTSSKRYIRLSFTAAVGPQQSTLLCLTNWSKEIHCFVMKVLDILPLIHCFQNTSNPPHHVLHKGGQFWQ